MGPTPTRTPAACQHVAVLGAIALCALASGVARGDDSGPRWQGASWGLELRSGASFRVQDDPVSPAPILGAGLRVCTLLTLIDAELFATTVGFSRTTAAGAHDLRRTSIGVDLRLHPLFIRHLEGDLAGRIAAGVHLALGGALELLAIAGPDRDDTYSRFAFAIGLGLDLPLTEPNGRAWSLWLGLGWRLRFVGFPGSAPGLRDMDEHQALVSFGVRFHDLGFMRLPVPPELDDRDR
jgi:hypothetical protein